MAKKSHRSQKKSKQSDEWMEGGWEELEAYYNSFPPELREQLDNQEFLSLFDENKVVNHQAEKLYRMARERAGRRDGLREITRRLAILDSIDPRELLLVGKYHPYVSCYHAKRPSIRIVKKLTRHPHSIVMEGTYTHTETGREVPVIIKYFEHGHTDISEEIFVYEQLHRLNCKTPWFSRMYEFWGRPVLIMEKLDKIIDHTEFLPFEEEASLEAEFIIGAEVLCQLKYLHKFGVHSDIKPSNIMKSNISKHYFLIDHGGVTTEDMEYGYRRHTWTEGWCTQKLHPKDEKNHSLDQITTPKHDLLELGFTMRGLQILRLLGKNSESESDDVSETSAVDESKTDSTVAESYNGNYEKIVADKDYSLPKHFPGNPRKGLTGKLETYMKRVDQINRKEPIDESVYDELINILLDD